jgi:hypothetical protein
VAPHCNTNPSEVEIEVCSEDTDRRQTPDPFMHGQRQSQENVLAVSDLLPDKEVNSGKVTKLPDDSAPLASPERVVQPLAGDESIPEGAQPALSPVPDSATNKRLASPLAADDLTKKSRLHEVSRVITD